MAGTFVRGCRCAMSWCDLDLTFDLAVVTLSLKILNRLVLVLYLYIVLHFLSPRCYFLYLNIFLDRYVSDTELKVSRSLYCFTICICYGVENYFPRLCDMGISDAILDIFLLLRLTFFFPLYKYSLNIEVSYI